MDDNFALQYLVHTFAVCVNIFITDKYENNYPLCYKITRHLEVIYEIADLSRSTFLGNMVQYSAVNNKDKLKGQIISGIFFS